MGALLGASGPGCMFTQMYIPSSMLWKGSLLIVAAGKSTEEHFARKGLSDGVKRDFWHRSRERARSGREDYGISACEIPRPGCLCTIPIGLF